MRRTVGYMLTWTTYGSWLQGDERGWVRDGKVQGPNAPLRQANASQQVDEVVHLSAEERTAVRKAILEESARQKYALRAVAVAADHVHVVMEYQDKPIGQVVRGYKSKGWAVLRSMRARGKLWTRGYDKRFCFDKATLEQRAAYVERHVGGVGT